MAPPSSKSKGKPQSRDVRRSRSRNTTPVSAGPVTATVEGGSSYLITKLASFNLSSIPTLEDILDRGSSSSNIPTAGALSAVKESIVKEFVAPRTASGETSERLMREMVRKRKDREQHEREKERADREAEERRQKLKNASKKRERSEERPLAVGARGVARQDGVDVHKDISSSISSPVSPIAPPTSGVLAARADDVASPASSELAHQPPPAPTVPQYETFGPDPSKFPDPTIYHIREITPDMTEEEKKEVLCVGDYPHDDLHDLTPGTPPDRDFSNAKPSNQVSANAFQTWVEPFIRPLTEEDLSFLKDKGDRSPSWFVVPRRGPQYYKEVWAEEDGAMAMDLDNDAYPSNEPRGDMDDMNDHVAETDQISTGPVLARLLSTLRPERRSTDTTTNGDALATNGVTNGDMELDGDAAADTNPHTSPHAQPPATFFPESKDPLWRANPLPKPDYSTYDERVLQELRHIGFIGPDEQKPDAHKYDAHADDEVAARLRHLQAELKRASIVNGARKERLLDLARYRMAQQEYATVAEDVDAQLNQAYLKRSRNMGKGKKNVKRPGAGAGAAAAAAIEGISKPALGEPIRSLMERKANWREKIGPVVDYGMSSVPTESVFQDEIMRGLVTREQESWDAGETAVEE